MAPPGRWRVGWEEGRLGLLDRVTVLEVPSVPRLYVDAICEARCGAAAGRAAGPRLRTPIWERRPMASARALAPARADPGEAASREQLGRIDLRRGRGWGLGVQRTGRLSALADGGLAAADGWLVSLASIWLARSRCKENVTSKKSQKAPANPASQRRLRQPDQAPCSPAAASLRLCGWLRLAWRQCARGRSYLHACLLS